MIGSIIIAVVFALFTAKDIKAKKVITVEDFVGGFIIGFLAGIYGELILEKLKIAFFG